MTCVPDQYRGVWARKLLETPDKRDDSTYVRWLQTSAWHADLRVPSNLEALDTQSTLACQQGFCGVTEVSTTLQGDVCTWHRRYDFQPPRSDVDAGLMMFETPDRVIEIGIHAPYREVWEKLPDSTGRFITLASLDEHGRDSHQRLLIAGRYVMHVRPRTVSWSEDVESGQNFASVLAKHADCAAALLDFEISLGTLENGYWSIEQSTLATRKGVCFPLYVEQFDASTAFVDGTVHPARWHILEWCCADARL